MLKIGDIFFHDAFYYVLLYMYSVVVCTVYAYVGSVIKVGGSNDYRVWSVAVVDSG